MLLITETPVKMYHLILPILLTPSLLVAQTPTPEQIAFFERKIRPVLVDKCYQCHSAEAEKPKGGLRLDTREFTRQGGDSGPAVVPGDVSASLLVEAIRHVDPDTAMPPKKSGNKLPDAVILDFETWIKMGAPDPRDAPAGPAEKVSNKTWKDYGDAAKWWAWQLPVKKLPTKKASSWDWGTVDQFVSEQRETKGLTPVADADPSTWLRRVYFDLIGLPPRPQEVMDFVKDFQQNPTKARETTVDKLLASEHFGERWGRHWLDVARYGESSGKEVNIAFPHAWRYRDYVIHAFNADKPFDQFLTEQIAGDLLPAKDARQQSEQTVATGFLAMGPKSLNEMSPVQYALDVADEQIDAVSQAFLATTIACARCHDHKFDPIPQKEYYALAGIFLSTSTRYGTATSIQNRHSTDLIKLSAEAGLPMLPSKFTPEEIKSLEKELATLKKERDTMFRENLAKRRKGGSETSQNDRDQQRRIALIVRTGELETRLKAYDEEGNSRCLSMGVQDQPIERKGGASLLQRLQRRLGRPAQFSQINDSPVYLRGEADKPGERVKRGFVSVLTQGEAPTIPSQSSGRLELAQWMVSQGNPLTARVMVNRVWHWLFGRGIVPSVDNFGTTGDQPSNQPLLDYLALRFSQDQKWSVKALVRELVLSHTYALSSNHHPASFIADPDNTLCWRMSPRRLEAECIRDAMLTVSSSIDLRPPVGSAVAKFGDGPIGGPRLRGLPEASLLNPQANYRSVYLPAPRNVLPEILTIFDITEGTVVSGSREVTNTPTQALYLMNSPFVAQQAEKFARKLLEAFPPSGPNPGIGDRLTERVRWAYSLCFSRWPTESELSAAQAFFTRFPATWQKGIKFPIGLKDNAAIAAAWTSYCRALMASAEFRELN